MTRFTLNNHFLNTENKMEESNKPYFTARDKGLSVSFFKHDKDGKTYFGVSLQRSYKPKEGDWKREKINLFLEELLPLATLINTAYTGFVRQRQIDAAIAKDNTGNYPQSSYEDQTPPEWVTEDIGF